MFLSAVLFVSFGNQSMALDSQTDTEAQSKAQELLEMQEANARKDFALVNPLPVPPATFIQDDIYKKTVTVTHLDFFTKKITANVTWTGDRNRPQTVSLSTLVTNPGAVNGGSTCSSVLLGDWAHPQLLGTADVGQNNVGTDVDIFNQKAYVTANASSASKDDFYVIDVSDLTINNLPILKSLNTGPGLSAVHVAGNYAYVANQSRNGQLQIIDITQNPMEVVATYKINAVSGVGAQAFGNSIFYKDGYVFLGLTTTAGGPEFNIINVTNPSSPVWVSGYSVDHDINSIYVKGSYAYIASPANSELIILNISNPSSPSLTGQKDLVDNSANGKSLALVADILYLGRTVGASTATKELQLLSISNPALPAIGISMDIDSTVNAIAIRDYLAFILTNDPNLGFQIWNLNTQTIYGSKNVQQTSSGGMDCEGNYIYIAQRSNRALQIVGPGL